ncbi:MAG TPA: TlpA disulfide reductase family protein [Caulobacteraceae bacterium]
MSETQGGGATSPARKSTALIAVLAVIVVVAALYGAYALIFKPHGGDLKSLAVGPLAKLVVDDKPAPQPIVAQGPDGKTVKLADFKGKVVVVNLWATWCAPCVKEMPTLALLQSRYAGKPLTVMPISLDKGTEDIAKAKAFIADKPPLAYYRGDYALAFSITPASEGLPTTLIFDRQGRERARLEGGADWSTPQTGRLIDRLLAEPG